MINKLAYWILMSFLSLSDNLLQDTNIIIVWPFCVCVCVGGGVCGCVCVCVCVVLFCFVCMLFVCIFKADSFEIARVGVKCLAWFEVQFPLNMNCTVLCFILFYFFFNFCKDLSHFQWKSAHAPKKELPQDFL